MKNYSTGNSIVDKVGKISIAGNVIPMIWFQTIRHENQKPNMNAIMILADIVYWYRPTEIRDEVTGQVVGIKKKFREDLLQRSYQQMSEQFGLTKRQIVAGINTLQDIGVLKKHFRNLSVNGQKVNNVLYIELVPEKLFELTYPSEQSIQDEENNQSNKACNMEDNEEDIISNVIGHTIESDRATTSNVIGHTIESDRCTHLDVTDYTIDCKTNTEITTKNNLGDYLINQSESNRVDKIDEIEQYTKILKENIAYDILKFDLKGDTDKLDEILDLLVETVCVKRKTIRIAGANYPFELVKGKLLKLDSSHIRYVIDSMSNNTTKILNIKNYLLTALYNAPNTINNYYSARVNHDLYNKL